MMSDGKALTLDDLEDLDEDAKLGVGAAEDFSWKGILDFTPAPSAVAARTSARPGTPRSRCRPS